MPALLERIRPARPLTLFDQLRDEMDRMFEGFPMAWPAMPVFRPEAAFVPAIEVMEKKGVLLVKADLPGLKKEEVSVEITPQGLTIAGERKSEVKEEKEGYYRTERSYGEFSRFVPLPEGALIDKAIATFKDGVLEVQVPLPKLEKAESKKLPIL
jgi:HSP20 family protein